jgi:hypothetical protein
MALAMTVPNGRALTLSNANQEINADREIILDYDPEYGVKVKPKRVYKNKTKTICFKGKNGTKVRVIFVSPFGDELLEMADSETRKLTVGGIYHFKCFFTPVRGKEIASKTGGILDVQPHRP